MECLKKFVLAVALCIVHFPSHGQIVEEIDYSDRADVDNTFDMAGEDRFGQRFPSEHLTIEDEETGIEIIALTTSRHRNSTLYQTHPQWTPDSKYIVFRSSRGGEGGGQMYAVSMENYEIVQITTGKRIGSFHLGWKKNRAYYFRDRDLMELDLGVLLTDSEEGSVQESSAYEKAIATLPEGINPSGDFALDANEDRLFFIDRPEEDLSAIYSIDFASQDIIKHKEVPFWANHLQANRWVPGEMMYCWETGGDAPQRMWYLSVNNDGKADNQPVYKEAAEEWVTHEVIVSPDHVLFNVMGHLDRLRKHQTGIFIQNIRTGETEIVGQTGGGGYWHAAGTQDLKWIVGDTFDGSLYRLNVTTGERTLLTAGHRPNSKGPFTNEAHSHHSVSPDEKWVLFNSSMLTSSDIMLIPLHPEGL